jgi:NAD(P)-dependent dehydrogenase (short-subunit alcohol dehydrogenase family)
MLLVSRAVIPHMQRQGGGAIVNTGSTASLVGEPNCVSYDATKGAVLQLTRQMAIDFAKDGIRVNCICPGWIDTGFNDPIFDDAGMSPQEIDDAVKLAIPMNRQGTAADVAPSVAFLFSGDAAYITGTTLVIDGGFVAQ